MKVVRSIGLILLGIIIWVAGFIFISIPALDEWKDCREMNRLDGKTDSGFYCHVDGGSHGGCDESGLCVDAYSSEMATSVPELGICLVLPAVPLIIIIAVLVRSYVERSKVT